MIITCNECDTRFSLEENLLKQTGSKVRCSKCKNIFLAYPPSLSEELYKSSELETELEYLITDEEIESDEQDNAEEKLEDIELTVDENFEKNTKVEEKPEEASLELDIDLDPDIDETNAESEAELELELGDKTESEISVEEYLKGIETDKETETKIEESNQEEIEQDKPPVEYHAEKIQEEKKSSESSKTFNMGVRQDEQDAEKTIASSDNTEQDALTEKTEPPKIAAKKRISMPVLLFLIAAILIIGAYGIYMLLDGVGIDVPFVSDSLKPEIQDTGNLKIYASDINNKFIENSKTGKLLIVTGKAKNGYSNARSYISITGKLYTKGKILSKTKTVYCGTILSELELTNMALESINKRLANRFGDNKSNIKVKAGSIIPFMIVFANIPENLDEFTIEVAGSSPS